ncbi:tyrosine-protein phosphatase [Candidatus Venteria ishoeyi]|uniref:protein-tyrosine-phosphatase n=1 Tax=Candidatus Venteria ishoeyi TaxID=1899563 RepID=A0A1H6FER8_9GAMM|nr:CpsB/CapC family capsule biosynthesis tyrosine phosphatase [Candidatus Venteria ishoeyi]SEH08562.1 Tyrosine-protein phosphatase YwqE [Candidatus Venteria ishoeyi]
MQIDLHCHMLPDIDDGPKTVEESKQLLALFAADNIDKFIVTPHITPGQYNNNKTTISAAYNQFTKRLKNQTQLLGFAAEVRASIEIIPLIEQQEIPFLGQLDGYDILLLEMPHDHIPLGTDKLIQWLLDRKIRPMIAHPERNLVIIKNLDKIKLFIESGCLLQLTSGSVAGLFKPDITHRAQEILEKGWATILATDAHNCKYRPPTLTLGRKAAAEVIGEEAAWALVRETPLSLLKHLRIT